MRSPAPQPATGGEPSRPQTWAVGGGGILGMTLAHRLAQSGRKVTLFEAGSKLGGLASAWELGDLTWDRHYHVTLLSDLRLRALLTELGLADDMRWVETKTGVYADGRLHSVSNALEFLRFPPLGLIDKLRLGFTLVYASRVKHWERLERTLATTWLQRWSGERTLRKFWLPLLRSKLGDNAEIASAAFIWAIIRRLQAARRTGLKKEMFGYLPGGYARMLERFGEVLRKEDVEIRLGSPLRSVERTPSGLQIQLGEAGRCHFDRVVLTLPAPIAADLCPDLGEDERRRLRGIRYQGIVCASLLLQKPLSPFYVTNITDDFAPFTGVIEMTALVDPALFGSRTLVYLPKYVPSDDPAFSLPDSEIESTFLAALERMHPDFHRGDVLAFRVSRVRYVLPISTLDYSRHLPPMHTSIPGLHIVNSAHILNGTLNVDETVRLAESAAHELLGPGDRPGGEPAP